MPAESEARGLARTAQVAAYSERLRAAGYKLTRARRAVLETLFAKDGDHLTSAEILARVQQRAPSVSRVSVFRALDLFARLVYIRPSYMHGSQGAVYVRLDGGHHHHVICIRCQRVLEFEDCGLATLTEELERQFRVSIRGHLLEFYAFCQDCGT